MKKKSLELKLLIPGGILVLLALVYFFHSVNSLSDPNKLKTFLTVISIGVNFILTIALIYVYQNISESEEQQIERLEKQEEIMENQSKILEKQAKIEEAKLKPLLTLKSVNSNFKNLKSLVYPIISNNGNGKAVIMKMKVVILLQNTGKTKNQENIEIEYVLMRSDDSDPHIIHPGEKDVQLESFIESHSTKKIGKLKEIIIKILEDQKEKNRNKIRIKYELEHGDMLGTWNQEETIKEVHNIDEILEHLKS